MVQSKKRTLGAILTISPLIRRVGIYLLLSTITVASMNLIEINHEDAYKIYLPLFIAIYVLSRWIDSKFNQSQATKELQDNNQGLSDTKGFATNSKP